LLFAYWLVSPTTSAMGDPDCVRLYQISRIVQQSVAYKEQDPLALRILVSLDSDLRDSSSPASLGAVPAEAPECPQRRHVGTLGTSASAAGSAAFAAVSRGRAQRSRHRGISVPSLTRLWAHHACRRTCGRVCWRAVPAVRMASNGRVSRSSGPSASLRAPPRHIPADAAARPNGTRNATGAS
jgi:hypothetical protein